MDTAETPKIGISSFVGGKVVSLSCETEGATIYYTLDGTIPGENSAVYEGPITLSDTAVVKAIAIRDGMAPGKVATGKIRVERVEMPKANIEGGRVTAGTVITLNSETDGAMIYYTLDGSEPTAESERYSGGIALTEDVTLKAIALKGGYRNSAVFEATYKADRIRPGTAAITAADAVGRAGDNISVPIYFFGENEIDEFEITLKFDDSKFKYLSVTPSGEMDSRGLSVFVSGDTVTLRYKGLPLESGEVCNINLTSEPNTPEGEYPVSISAGELTSRDGSRLVSELTDGVITLTNPEDPGNVVSGVVLTDREGNDIETEEDLRGKITAGLTIEDPEEFGPGETPEITVIMAVYDRNGCLADMCEIKLDLREPNRVFTSELQIPEGTQGGKIKLMVWTDLKEMKPVSPAKDLL